MPGRPREATKPKPHPILLNRWEYSIGCGLGFLLRSL